jgi:uncharacterized protein (TIGR03067 family)
MKLVLWVVCTCGLLAAAAQAVEKEKAKSDKDALQGTWTAVSGTHDGKEMTGDELKATLTFKGDMVTLKHGDKSSDHKFKLNPDKSPKEIDLEFGEKTGKGIYHLDGDTMKIAHGELDGDRPKDFKGGDKLTSVVFKREKK